MCVRIVMPGNKRWIGKFALSWLYRKIADLPSEITKCLKGAERKQIILWQCWKLGFSGAIEPRSKALIRQPQNRRLTPKRFTVITAAIRVDNYSSLLTGGEGFENQKHSASLNHLLSLRRPGSQISTFLICATRLVVTSGRTKWGRGNLVSHRGYGNTRTQKYKTKARLPRAAPSQWRLEVEA